MWNSIPVALKKLELDKVRDLGFDVKDSLFLKLLKIRTKTEFAKEFKISAKQLTRWDKSKVVQKITDDINKASNVMRFKKDIDFNFTMMTMKESDAARVRLWKQVYEGFKEEEVQRQPELEKLANAIKKWAEKE